ncbi:MAG: carbohydrate ABC transporter substrate-binding protein [Lachnospiraceae bacterium]|nr:carbohydrate ABC transporter substrate-binding protein [Lachnospiraceae bacterium]
MRQNIAALLAASLLLGLCAGCGASDEKAESADTSKSVYVAYDAGATAQEAAAEEEKQEKVFVIYCIGEDFRNRVRDFYPGYESEGEDSGRIGDVRVQWNVYSDAQEYREDLDERLGMQADRDTGALKEDSGPNEKVDLFVVDEAFLRDYVESGWSLDVKAGAGLTEEELSDQFLYTQQMATDAEGKLKAVSWQATPGVFAYRRSIAKEVLGTDEPEKVQEAVSDWETFAQTAQTMKEAGYYMLSAYGDAYRVYADNVTSAWVEDGALNIDPHLEDWAVQTREFAENGYIHGTEQWSEEWRADHTGDGEVFGFFYSSWGIHYTLQRKADGETDSEEDGGEESEEVSSASGDYAVCRGPEPSHYGGQWIIAAAGGDDTELAGSIMRELTCNPEIMKKITRDIREVTNTVSGMTELGQSDYKAEVLGGQNPIPVYVESAKLLSKRHTTSYDDDLDLGFQVTMQDYFDGKVSETDALETFRKVALSRYEELEDVSGDEEGEEEE